MLKLIGKKKDFNKQNNQKLYQFKICQIIIILSTLHLKLMNYSNYSIIQVDGNTNGTLTEDVTTSPYNERVIIVLMYFILSLLFGFPILIVPTNYHSKKVQWLLKKVKIVAMPHSQLSLWCLTLNSRGEMIPSELTADINAQRVEIIPVFTIFSDTIS